MPKPRKVYTNDKPAITSYEQLEKLFDSGYREFNDLIFDAVDLSKPASNPRPELSTTDVNEAVFQNCKFVNCGLRNVSLYKFTLSCCYFNNCDMPAARFLFCHLNGCSFGNTVATNASFNGSRMQDVIFRSTDLLNAEFVDTDLARSIFLKVDITGANFAFANLASAVFDYTVGGPVVRLDVHKWSVVVYPQHTQVGCQVHKNDDWLKWKHTDAAICNMHHQAESWWKQYGPLIKSTIRYVMKESKKCQQQQLKS
jgi:hypothetical protein